MSYGLDRTDEFFHLAQLHTPQNRQAVASAMSMDGSSRLRPSGVSRLEGVAVPLELSAAASGLSTEEAQFSNEAVSVGQELNQAERKIEELQKFAKHRGIFEDRSVEIQALTYDIRQTILALNSRIDLLDRSAQSSSVGLHNQVHHRSVVQTLRTRLGEVTRRLKVILEDRAKAMKNQEDRRSLYSHSATSAPRFHEEDNSSTMQTIGQQDLETGGLLHEAQTFAPRQSSYHSARAEAVEAVQTMIGELAQIFNRVATLVTAQEELTVRIEDDMSSALHNLQQGEAHLLKYFRSISSNRSLIFKVFSILFLFIVFFVVFLA